jgi:hypothetical protein
LEGGGNGPATGHDRGSGQPQDGHQRVAAPGTRPRVRLGGQVGEQLRCFSFLEGPAWQSGSAPTGSGMMSRQACHGFHRGYEAVRTT